MDRPIRIDSAIVQRLRGRADSCELQTKWGNHFFGDANDVQLFRDAADWIEKLAKPFNNALTNPPEND